MNCNLSLKVKILLLNVKVKWAIMCINYIIQFHFYTISLKRSQSSFYNSWVIFQTLNCIKYHIGKKIMREWPLEEVYYYPWICQNRQNVLNWLLMGMFEWYQVCYQYWIMKMAWIDWYGMVETNLRIDWKHLNQT